MSPQRKAIAFWLAVGAAGFLALPWYALQDSIISTGWIRSYAAKDNAPALLQGLRHGRVWLLAIGAILLAASVLLAPRLGGRCAPAACCLSAPAALSFSPRRASPSVRTAGPSIRSPGYSGRSRPASSAWAGERRLPAPLSPCCSRRALPNAAFQWRRFRREQRRCDRPVGRDFHIFSRRHDPDKRLRGRQRRIFRRRHSSIDCSPRRSGTSAALPAAGAAASPGTRCCSPCSARRAAPRWGLRSR